MALLAFFALLGLILLALVVLWPAALIRLLIVPLAPGVIFTGPVGAGGDQKLVALSIDDGPSGGGSDALIDLLRLQRTPATFFLIGDHLAHNPTFPHRALAAGHELGNHLMQDGKAVFLSKDQLLASLRQTERAMETAAAPYPLRWRWFRPAGGFFHPAMLHWIRSGDPSYRLVLGSVFPWDTFKPPLWFMRWFVLANLHDGAIIVLHDTRDLSGRTIALLSQLLPALRRRGYQVVPLRELLRGQT